MQLKSISIQVVQTEPFKYFFCCYFKVTYDLIKSRSTFISGIISKICKVENKTHRSKLNNRGPSIDPCSTS